MRRFRENFYRQEAPLKLKWLWEEKLAAVVVVLWLLAEAFAIYYLSR